MLSNSVFDVLFHIIHTTTTTTTNSIYLIKNKKIFKNVLTIIFLYVIMYLQG